MNMIVMAILLVAVYFTSLLAIIVFRNKINTKIGNIFFAVLDALVFLAFHYSRYLSGSFNNFLTLDNISPFTFTVIPFTLLMHDKAKDWYFCAIAFLTAGMFGAMLVSPNYAYLFYYRMDATLNYTLDALCHLVCSLFGAYLVITRQVRPTLKNFGKSVIVMHAILTTMVILNALFHTRFFGMNPYENYSIYMFDFFGNFPATLIAFYLAIVVVLFLGLGLTWILSTITDKIDNYEEEKAS